MGEEKKIVLYGTTWCGSSRTARRLFDENHIEYDWVDIDQDMDARKYVEEVNHGYRSVPTIVFPDGSMLVEPSSSVLKQKIGVV
jgi:mycoredoxin